MSSPSYLLIPQSLHAAGQQFSVLTAHEICSSTPVLKVASLSDSALAEPDGRTLTKGMSEEPA